MQCKEVIKPPALQHGDTIAIVAPAGPPDPVLLDQGVRFFKDAGFNVVVGNHVLSRQGYLAGSDKHRADDFNECLHSPDIRGIFCARGGYGSSRILSSIDFQSLLSDPKVIVGFSDISAILNAVFAKTGVVTFHGPMASAKQIDSWSMNHLLKQIRGNIETPYRWPFQAEFSVPTYPQVSDESNLPSGILLGGCLSIISSLCGTPWQIPKCQSILFLEETGEAPYRIDRMMTQLKNAGILNSCSAVMLGQFANCIQRPDDPEPTPDTMNVLHEILRCAGVPVLNNIPVGHESSNFTMPIGVKVTIESDRVVQNELGVD